MIKLNNETIRTAVELWLNNYVFNTDTIAWEVKISNNEAIDKYGHISNWDTSNVTDMDDLFYNLNGNLFNEDIGKWDVSNVTTMECMFCDAKSFNQDLNNWNVSNVTSMRNMFNYCKAFNKPLDKWNVSKVKNMEGMFAESISFNQDISNWNVSRVEDMNRMFFRAWSFNKNIGSWDVSNVKNMECMFCYAKLFNNAGNLSISSWNVSNVNNLSQIFASANSFNQDIGKWPIMETCSVDYDSFIHTSLNKDVFEGKLYGNKIAEYFKLDNPNQFMVMEPYTRWERRKNAIMFFNSISKMNIDEDCIKSKNLNLIRKIDYDVYKEIVLFI